jgi:hypothetical protein
MKPKPGVTLLSGKKVCDAMSQMQMQSKQELVPTYFASHLNGHTHAITSISLIFVTQNKANKIGSSEIDQFMH